MLWPSNEVIPQPQGSRLDSKYYEDLDFQALQNISQWTCQDRHAPSSPIGIDESLQNHILSLGVPCVLSKFWYGQLWNWLSRHLLQLNPFCCLYNTRIFWILLNFVIVGRFVLPLMMAPILTEAGAVAVVVAARLGFILFCKANMLGIPAMTVPATASLLLPFAAAAAMVKACYWVVICVRTSIVLQIVTRWWPVLYLLPFLW